MLRNTTTSGGADLQFTYGQSSDRVLTGDWDGNGTSTPGVVRAELLVVAKRQQRGWPAHRVRVRMVHRPTDRRRLGRQPHRHPGHPPGNSFYLRNSNSSGAAEPDFAYGTATDRPVVGDWDGNGTFTPGVVRSRQWMLRNSNSLGSGPR